MPQFSPTPQTSVGGVDYMGAANNQYQGQLGAYNTQQQSAAADRGGLYGLAGTAALAAASYYSDRRVKENIRKVGKLDNGLDVYSYNYVWGGPTQIGVMAQDVEKVNPHAVTEDAHGVKMVNYAEAVGW